MGVNNRGCVGRLVDIVGGLEASDELVVPRLEHRYELSGDERPQLCARLLNCLHARLANVEVHVAEEGRLRATLAALGVAQHEPHVAVDAADEANQEEDDAHDALVKDRTSVRLSSKRDHLQHRIDDAERRALQLIEQETIGRGDEINILRRDLLRRYGGQVGGEEAAGLEEDALEERGDRRVREAPNAVLRHEEVQN